MKAKYKISNRILSFVLGFVMVVGLLPVTSFTAVAATTPTAYDGVPVTPTIITSSNYHQFGLTESNWSSYNGYYGIRNAKELYGFAALVNGGSNSSKAVLLQDIVINSGTVTQDGSSSGTTYSWTPIGTTSNPFLGTFDGNGCTISGLYINGSSSGVGLFGVAGRYTTSIDNIQIKNLVLSNSYIHGYQYVGGIAGCLQGNFVYISNCRIASDVTVATNSNLDSELGGVVGGYTNVVMTSYIHSIKNCVVYGKVVSEAIYNFVSDDVTTINNVGAITGMYQSGQNSKEYIAVENCYFIKGCIVAQYANDIEENDVYTYYPDFGKGGSSYTYNTSTGCTILSSASDSHTCVSVTHREVSATCQYPGLSEYAYCLICGTVTSGTKTEEAVVAHNYTIATCTVPATCIYCDGISGTVDKSNHTGTASVYSVSSSDVSKHELRYSCCNALAETSEHSFDGEGYCATCKYQCTHSQMKDYICQTCGKSGVLYLNPVWNSQTNKMDYVPTLTTTIPTVLTSAGTLTSGWYIVKNNVNISGVLTIQGTVNLILADGAKLSAGMINCSSGNTLNIYAQSVSPDTAGQLTASSTYYAIGCSGGASTAGTITINGGIINANSQNNNTSVAIGGGGSSKCGTITVNGGVVTANGRMAGIGRAGDSSGKLVVKGGVVIASGVNVKTESYQYGIVFEGNNGNIYGSTFTLEHDFTVPSGKTLTIEEGKTLVIEEGVTLTINGTVVKNGTIINNGTIICNNGHTYRADCISTCHICEQERTPLSEHTYDSSCDEMCNTCEEYRTTSISHDYENGICKNCGAYEVPDIIDSIYQIKNLGNLMWFADYVNSGNTDADAVVVQNIDATAVSAIGIGTGAKPYAGAFDGGGCTITVALEGSTYVALFGYVNGATIKNLIVDGTVKASGMNAAGIISRTASGDVMIENCLSKVNIISSVSGDGTHGGLVGVANAGTLNINNCGFIGSITGTGTNSCGGFVGWANVNTTIKNSYVSADFELDTANGSDSSNTFSRNPSKVILNNCYYLNELKTTPNTATKMTKEQFKSGEVTWLLNGETAIGVWKQTLEEDDYPNFDGDTVYATPLDCGGKNASGYSNEVQSAIPHVYDENGICSAIAGEHHYEPAVLNEGIYKIYNIGNLMWFAELVNGTLTDGTAQVQSADAVLMADIDLTGYAWTPIGVTAMGEAVTDGYTGNFDGNGHVISNVAFATPASEIAAGIFGTVQSGGTVKHLGVEKLTFDNNSYDHRAGGIAGQLLAGSTISDCYVINSTVKASSRVVGGIVGMNKGTVENCYTYNMTLAGANNRFGGISGDYTGGTLENCYTNYSALASSQTGTNTNCEAGVSAERFASGEVTYKLNDGVTDGTQVWYQTLGTDHYPQFAGEVVLYDETKGYSNHTHAWEYSVNDAVITAKCSDADDNCMDTNGGNVTISVPADLTYDGTEKEAVITDTLVTGDTVTVEYSGEKLVDGKPVHAGKYTATVTVGDNKASATVDFAIAPKTVSVTAEPKSKTYGEADPAFTYIPEGLVDGELLTGELTRETGENAGDYAITQGTLTNEKNPDYNITFVEATFTINKAKASEVNNPVATEITYGQALSASALSDGWSWADGSDIPTVQNGGYKVVKNVNDDNNYDYSDIEGYEEATHTIIRNVALNVSPKPIAVPAADNTVFTYNGAEQTYAVAENEYYTISGNKQTGAGTYTVTVALKDTVNTKWSDDTVTAKDYTFTIGKAEQTITASDVTLTYGDTGKTVTARTDGDGALTYAVATGTDVIRVAEDGVITTHKEGTATIAITAAETSDYAQAVKTVTVNVTKAKLTVEWTDTEFDYDGLEHKPTATLKGVVEGNSCNVTVTGAQTDAGEDYVATASIDNNNYEIATGKTATFTIHKAKPEVAEAPTVADRVYSPVDTLAKSVLTGGEVTGADGKTLSGVWSWQLPDAIPVVKNNGYVAVFTPEDTKNYNTVETVVTLKVDKAEATPNMPDTAIDVPYSSKTVGAVTLPEGWVWLDADKNTALVAGVSVKATAVYTGKDKGNYENETVEITITRSVCEHTGGTASCTEKAVCGTCGEAYGTVDPANHVGGTEVRDVKEATCGAEGYTGDTYCKDCGTKTKTGEAIPKKTHTYGEPAFTWSEDGKSCTITFTCEKDTTHTAAHVATVTSEVKIAATCKNMGTTTYTATYNDTDKVYSAEGKTYTDTKDVADIPVDVMNHVGGTEVRDTKEATCGAEGYTGDTYCKSCGEKTVAGKTIPKTENHKGGTANCKDKAICMVCGNPYGELSATHTWDSGVVTKEATTTEKGEKTFTCTICGGTNTEEIPVISGSGDDTPPAEDNPGTGEDTPPVEENPGTGDDTPPAEDNPGTGEDTPPAEENPGTGDDTTPPVNLPETVYVTAEETEKTITSANTDKADVSGSTFAKLQLKATGKNKSIKLTWKKVKEADGYILYGAKCGNKLKKIKTFTKASTVKYTQKKLKKGTYYKYMVVAYKNVDGKKYVIASSKSAHAVTNGGKYANPSKVTVKASKITVKKGKSKTIKASYKIAKGKKFKLHIAKFRYQSSNTKIATVNKKGKVTGKKKGTCYIYVYAQNGVYKKVKVTVK